MELKKNPKANIEKWKSVFFQTGLILTLGAILYAFNISTQKDDVFVDSLPVTEFEVEDIPITRPKDPEPPKPKQQQIPEELNIVADDEDLDDEELEMQDTEIEEGTGFQIIEIVDDVEEDEEIIYDIADKAPKFPGGDKGLIKYISSHVDYPTIAREQGIEGKIYIRFCVNSTGNVVRVSLARGIDPILDKEALRVVKKLPKWTPGEKAGKAVSVWYTVPINFVLSK